MITRVFFDCQICGKQTKLEGDKYRNYLFERKKTGYYDVIGIGEIGPGSFVARRNYICKDCKED